jgi:hypothetical protein
MKKCSYCGAEYPDDATACVIDETPLDEVQSEPTHFKHPTFAIFSEHKIPVSLAIVSYLFFFPGAMCFAGVISILALIVISGGDAIGGWVVPGCVLGLAVGIFWTLLSRGLRRCSRGWRTCALFFIWWGFIAIAFNVTRYLMTQKTPDHESATLFWVGYGMGFVLQVWQYRVLTRPDVRELFGL